MKLLNNPNKQDAIKAFQRPYVDFATIENQVTEIIDNVKVNGDQALQLYSKKFDGVELSNFMVSEKAFNEANKFVTPELKEAIELAINNVEVFHKAQKQNTLVVETMPGVKCWQKAVPIEKVGLYIPGGTAPLFSTIIMLAVPAKIAGCEEIVMVTPPQKDGTVNPIMLYTAQRIGVTKVFKIGGAQSIAALAYGTESIPKVNKIFGPGNQYVTVAKQLVSREGVAIDMPAGPSEVLVFADEFANPEFIAADLLSQAEHGIDSQVVFITTSSVLVEKVNESLKTQLANLPRKEIAKKCLDNSVIIIENSIENVLDLINEYAPEHLIINTQNANEIADKVKNAGSVFIGPYTPESAGDYASGTNHTLPTNGYAKSFSGVNLDAFVKKISYQEISQAGIMNIGRAIEKMAKAELLDAHANAVTYRLNYLNQTGG